MSNWHNVRAIGLMLLLSYKWKEKYIVILCGSMFFKSNGIAFILPYKSADLTVAWVPGYTFLILFVFIDCTFCLKAFGLWKAIELFVIFSVQCPLSF